MTKKIKILAIVFAYNEGQNIKKVLSKFSKSGNYDLLIIDDCSADETLTYIKGFDVNVISNKVNKGAGGSIKTAIRYALDNGYEVIVLLAGNNKDNPEEIPRVLSPITEDNYDYVQGSRNLPGGSHKNLPLFRYIMVWVNAWIFRFLTGFKCTDALNGFRAYKLSIFDDARINIWQDWLDKYEFETYLHYKVLKLRYRVKEVPVSKTYPKRSNNTKYTNIRPFIDWWKIARPIFYLLLGIKK